jgi:hypothetical protein
MVYPSKVFSKYYSFLPSEHLSKQSSKKLSFNQTRFYTEQYLHLGWEIRTWIEELHTKVLPNLQYLALI